MAKTAIILGSTGLTGSNLLKILLQSEIYSKVAIFVRKEIKISHPKLVQYTVDFDNPDSYQDLIDADDLFCCLGTTIRKAGTEEAFEKVDLIYPIQFSQIAVKKGVKQCLIVSSMGANPNSNNFYMRTKGKCEEELRQQPFQATLIFRPSLLLGRRNEFRLFEKMGEYLMKLFSIFFVERLRKYRPIKAKKVAYAMYYMAQQNIVGYHVYLSDKISDIFTQRNK